MKAMGRRLGALETRTGSRSDPVNIQLWFVDIDGERVAGPLVTERGYEWPQEGVADARC